MADNTTISHIPQLLAPQGDGQTCLRVGIFAIATLSHIPFRIEKVDYSG
jgi:hypothetical protein